MFIREIIKKNPGYPKPFIYHRLMESIRTPKGPRQRVRLNLGSLDLPREDWKTLANRIEEIISGQKSFVIPPAPMETLAQHYAALLRQKEMQNQALATQEGHEATEPEWEMVDLNSQSQSQFRTLGGEIVGHWAYEKLGFPRLLANLGLSQPQIHQAALLIIGRLLHPASERETAIWGRELSALNELLGTDYSHLSNNALYRLSDRLYVQHESIEAYLTRQEKEAFGLGEKIILYDLTNTYLTGSGEKSDLARYGRSKQKRDDSPLLTLALVLDADGFPKASRILPGNAGEPASLKQFLDSYQNELRKRLPMIVDLPTVVIDAGIATAKNLAILRSGGFHYITVSRTRPLLPEDEDTELLVIQKKKQAPIEVKRLHEGEEVILYCRSTGRVKKEAGIRSRLQQRFEERLQAIAVSLEKRRGQRRYEKVVERIGRLKERYRRIAHFYQIEVTQEKGKATGIKWAIERKDELEMRFSGSYYIRSDRTELDEKELWSLYMTLGEVEDAFRSLKSELGMRPVFHRRDKRMEGHLFISVLAFHLLASVQRELSRQGIHHRWQTIREQLQNHMRVTSSITNQKGERLHRRQTGDPEPYHLAVYRALGVKPNPLATKRWKV
jgi:transposase